jgi:fructose-bisphosphate aldolase class II
MLLFFPWALTTIPALIQTAHILSLSAPVPITLHLDHAQTPALVRRAADSRCFYSIMVDMSHYARDENLRLTASLAAYCHDRGIAVEAEPGRIEGGEDGVRDTADLDAVLHEPRRSARVRSHGASTGSLRLSVTCTAATGPAASSSTTPASRASIALLAATVRLVLHGTDGFDAGVYQRCIQGGVSKVNVDRVVNERWVECMREGVGVTEGIERGMEGMRGEVEGVMRMLGSVGRA